MKNGDLNAYPLSGPVYREATGLTKRELIAAMIMQGLAAGLHEFKSNQSAALAAVKAADALLEELAK